MNKIKDYVSEVVGTAGEAHQMNHFNKLKDTYGEEISLGILKPHLQKVGLTVDDFKAYRKVKAKIQSGQLNIGEIRADINNISHEAIAEVLI